MGAQPLLTVESMDSEKECSFTVPLTMYNTNKLTPNCIFCFVEGKSDTDYYFSKVKGVFGRNHLFINCYQKKFVLKMYRAIHEKDKDTKKLAFFVDHDYDEHLQLEHVYETECYSIENYYCYKEAFSEFLQYGLHVDIGTAEYQDAMNFYIHEFEKFHNTILELNAWIAVCKAKDTRGEMSHIDKLGTSIPKDFLVMDFGGEYRQNYDIDELNRHFNANPQITKEEHESMIEYLRGQDYFQVFRGKYELHFLYELLLHLRYKASHKKKGERAILEKSIVTWQIDFGNMMKYCSDYAFYPQKLKTFLLSYNM